MLEITYFGDSKEKENTMMYLSLPLFVPKKIMKIIF
jgi:hypothetical protein